MQIVLKQVDWAEKAQYLCSNPQQSNPPWKEFDRFFEGEVDTDGRPIMCPGYCAPEGAAWHALLWSWAKWHLDADFQAIQKNLKHTVDRGILLHQTKVTIEREKFDMLMIFAAVLTGDRDCMARAAESVWFADLSEAAKKKYQLYQALSGLVRFRILGDWKKEVEQYEKFIATGTVPYYPLPGKALLKKFVERDYKAFHSQLKKDCERYNKHVEKERASMHFPKGGTSIHQAVIEKSPDRLVIDLSKRIGRYYWPWVEAVFAKLALCDGAKIDYDSVWLPLEFVRAGMVKS